MNNTELGSKGIPEINVVTNHHTDAQVTLMLLIEKSSILMEILYLLFPDCKSEFQTFRPFHCH
jgi:hypothetical protein